MKIQESRSKDRELGPPRILLLLKVPSRVTWTVILKTDLDGIIHPEGWIEWDGNFALSTLYYAEYLNAGLGAATANRVKWPGFHVLNNPQQAAPFTVTGFIQGDSWIPATGVPFWLGI